MPVHLKHGLSHPCHLRRSGTTGTPKGVMATHRNYVSGIAGARNLLVQVRPAAADMARISL